MPRRYRPKRKPFYKKPIFWKLIFILIVSFGVGYFFLLSPFFEIRRIEIAGTMKIPKKEIEKLVKPKTNLLLFSPKNFEDVLKKIFIHLQSIKIEKKFPDKLSITVEERRPLAIICESKKEDNLPESENCFLASFDGVIFEAFDPSKKISDLLFIEIGETKLQIGKKVIDKKILNGLDFTKKILKELGIGIVKVVFEKEKITILSSFEFEIYLAKDVDFKTQAQVLGLILKEKIDKGKWGSLYYIDLSSLKEGKVYFK